MITEDLIMATDRSILEGLFAGNNLAFYRFDKDNRNLFEAYFHKHFPSTSVDIGDLYQETILELWSQIMDGRLTQSTLTVDISSYLIAIGRNKFFEEARKHDKYSRLKKGERVFRKRRAAMDEAEASEDSNVYSLQSKKQQQELNSSINEQAYEISRPVQVDLYREDEKTAVAKRIEKQQFIEEQVRKMEEPCKSVIRDTWWNDLTDEEIIRVSNGLFPTTNAVKTRRYRCHQKLKGLIADWYNKQLNA